MMKSILTASLIFFGIGAVIAIVDRAHADSPATQPASTPLQFTMKLLDGKDKNLADYRGKVVLIVNTASHCGFTRQFDGLEKLHKNYKEKGLVVLGFPSDDFNQEEDTAEGISNTCRLKYGVTFDMFSPIHVKGDEIHPLYAYLTSPEHNNVEPQPVKWNFEKFLIGKDGRIINHYTSKVEPDSEALVEAIEAELAR